jgi:hypothetical protein
VSSKQQKCATNNSFKYSIVKCKKIIAYWAKELIKPRPKNKREWLEVAWKVTAEF